MKPKPEGKRPKPKLPPKVSGLPKPKPHTDAPYRKPGSKPIKRRYINGTLVQNG